MAEEIHLKLNKRKLWSIYMLCNEEIKDIEIVEQQ
jgi:hypothetical protein